MAAMVVKQATSGIFDQYRGVFVNRGVFLKAPPEFFAAYPSNFAAPPFGWEKLKVHVRTIESWDKIRGLTGQPEVKVAPKVEIPVPAPTVVASVVETVTPAVAPAMSAAVQGDVVPPKRGRGRPRNDEKKTTP